MKYQNVKLRQAVVVYFMTLHYWAMKQSFPISPGFWVFGLHHWVGLRGLTMVNKQIGQCGALYRVIVLIVELLLTFSVGLKSWQDILVRSIRVHLIPSAAGPTMVCQGTENQNLYLAPYISNVVGEENKERRVHLGTFSREGQHLKA